MTEDIMKPEDCTFLKKRLGRKFGRVSSAYYEEGVPGHENKAVKDGRGRKPFVLMNPVDWYFTTLDTPIWENMTQGVEDIIYGVCRLDHSQSTANNNQLSAGKCVALLRRSSLTTEAIQRIIRVDKRQAQRYMRALRIMIPFIEKALNDKLDKDSIRYRARAVDDFEKWALEYDDDDLDAAVESIFTLLYTSDGISPDYNPLDE